MKTKKETDPEDRILIETPEELQNHKVQKSSVHKYLGPIFTVIGLAAVTGGIYLGVQRFQFLEGAHSADGEIVKFNKKRSDNNDVYYPVVNFKPAESYGVLTFEHESGSNPPSFAIGDPVKVLYDPHNPKHAIIDGGFMNWFAAGITSFLGIIFGAAGVSLIGRWLQYRKIKT